MKKLVKIVAAIALALSMTVTVFAAPSSTVNGTVRIIKAVDANGKTIVIDDKGIDEFNYIATREVQSSDKKKVDDAVADINATLKATGIKPAKNMKVVSAFDIYKVGNPAMPVDVTFAITGMTVDKEAYILHGVDGGWENVTTDKGKGTLAGKFNDFSPVIIVMEDGATASSTEAFVGQKGPATGVSYAWPAVIAVIALGGMTFLTIASKKKAR